MAELTLKQTRFVEEYLIDLNATQAAIRAGYSKGTARAIASENLSKLYIQEAIAAAMEKREKRTHITQDRVLQELSRIAFFDIRRIYDEKGLLKRPEDLDADTAAALSGIDVVEHAAVEVKGGEMVGAPLYTKRVKVFDKNAALTLAMRHLGMLRDKLEHSGPDGGPIKTIYLNNKPVDELPE